MKKFLLVLFSVCLLFAGCGTIDDIQRVSQDLNTYTINAVVDTQQHTISGHQNLTYKNTTGARLETICMHLYPNAFRAEATTTKAVSASQFEKAYPNGFSEGNITIGGVTYNDKTCGFEVGGVDKNILIISLPQPLDDGAQCVIDIDFVSLLPNANHRYGYGQHTINCGNFYPVLCEFEDCEWVMRGYSPNGDPFYSEMANYDVTIQYPHGYTLVSTGNQSVSCDEVNKTDTCTAVARAVRDFAFILSNQFSSLSTEVDGVTINYFYYDDPNAQTNIEVAVDALKTFEDMVGNYPYTVLNVCKANFLQGGMEYPNLVFISDAVDVDSQYKNVIIHEIAHQWFYGVVGNDEGTYPWLDEALVEYLTARFYDKNDGYELTTSSVLGSALSAYLLYCDMYREVYGEMDTSMNRSIYDYKTETEYVYMTYTKGVLMFDSLAEIVGQNKIEKCIARYYADNAFSNATPKDLIQSFERASGKNLTSFVTSWLDGSVVLEDLGR